MSAKQKNTFADQKMFGRAIKDSFIKLSPKTQAENPVMFLVFVSAILTSVLGRVTLWYKRCSWRLYFGNRHHPLVYGFVC